MKSKLKSIVAVIAGFLTVAILSTITDLTLEGLGVFTPPAQGFFTLWMILLALLYRTIFTVAGGYVTAWLAPNNPMTHSIILGVFGTIMATLAAVVAIPQNLSPAWFPITLVILAFPSAWLGGRLYKGQHEK